MIAKRITSKAAKPRVARLVKYMVAAEGQLDPRSWTRTADYMLHSKTTTKGEKVGGIRVTNCNTDDPAAATTLIEATQAANTRSKTDKTYHLVFSFPPGEEPDLKTLHAIEDALCAAIGYADHQRISAVHIDTDHLHVHVAINKVHPKGFQNIEPYFDKKKLMETCERLEIEYGLTRTNHGLHGETPKVKTKQAQAEAHSGIETLTGRVTRDLAPRLKEAKSWKEAHALLAEHGLAIKLRGAGLVIGSRDLWVKASQCDRALSFKAMTDRLGPFEKFAEKTTKAFEPKPRQNHPSSAVLFDQYQREKLFYKKKRDHGLSMLQWEAETLEVRLTKWYAAQRLVLNAMGPGAARQIMQKVVSMQVKSERKQNWDEIAIKRQKLISETRVWEWPVWLAQQAENGNTQALEVLRVRREQEGAHGDYLTVKDPGKTSHIVIPHLNGLVSWNGAVTYDTGDGGLVIDRSNHVQCFRTTAKSSRLALEIAVMRFKGQTLVVEGREDFQKEIAQLAKQRGIAVRFTKPVKPKAKTHTQTNGAEL